MTKEQFARIRADAGLTYDAVADYLRVTLRTAQRYESGERKIPGPVAKLMEQLEAAKERKQT